MCFSDSADYSLWGTMRAARNVVASSTDNPGKFNLIERGLTGFVESLPRDEADSAEVLFLVEGLAKEPRRGNLRCAALLTRTSYNPNVYDLTICRFKNEADVSTDAFPCNVSIATRRCRVSDRFEVPDTQTSSEFAALLCDMFHSMRLAKADYYIPLEVNNSLEWSRITELVDIGSLWAEGQKLPLCPSSAAAATERSFSKQLGAMTRMASGDPLTAPSASSLQADPRGRKRRPAIDVAENRTLGRRGNGDGIGNASTQLVPIAHEDVPRRGEPQHAAPPVGSAFRTDDGGEMDLADNDANDLEEEDIRELEATYGPDRPEDQHLERGAAADVTELVPDAAPPEDICQETVATVSSAVDEASGSLGLVGEAPTAGGSALSSADISGGQAGAESALPPPQPSPDWEAMSGPSASGYVYFGGRSVLRIQRGKPKGRVTVNCYKHRGCHVLINESKAPSDDELKRWLFEVDASGPEDPLEMWKAAAQKHMQSARARWTAPMSQSAS